MGTVVGGWRLNAMIVIFLVLTCMYTANAMFSNIQTKSDYESDYYIKFDEQHDTEIDDIELSENDTTLTLEGKDEGNSVINWLSGFTNFVSFGIIDNIYARFIITLFTSILYVCVIYIIYTYVKEWIPLT